MDTTHYVLSAYVHTLSQYRYVGKGRQQAARIMAMTLQRMQGISRARQSHNNNN